MNRRIRGQASTEPAFLAVDFFCGAGGTTRGLVDANGYVLAGIDKANSCRETYVKNNVNTSIDHSAPEYLEHDVFPACETYPFGEQDELMAKLKRLIPYYRSKAPCKPLLFAICAPCQPFTRLSRKELSRERRAGRSVIAISYARRRSLSQRSSQILSFPKTSGALGIRNSAVSGYSSERHWKSLAT